jgi:hypothetical protein
VVNNAGRRSGVVHWTSPRRSRDRPGLHSQALWALTPLSERVLSTVSGRDSPFNSQRSTVSESLGLSETSKRTGGVKKLPWPVLAGPPKFDTKMPSSGPRLFGISWKRPKCYKRTMPKTRPKLQKLSKY